MRWFRRGLKYLPHTYMRQIGPNVFEAVCLSCVPRELTVSAVRLASTLGATEMPVVFYREGEGFDQPVATDPGTLNRIFGPFDLGSLCRRREGTCTSGSLCGYGRPGRAR